MTTKMAAADFQDDTLVSVDPLIISCWEDKVKQGIDCSLLDFSDAPLRLIVGPIIAIIVK